MWAGVSEENYFGAQTRKPILPHSCFFSGQYIESKHKTHTTFLSWKSKRRSKGCRSRLYIRRAIVWSSHRVSLASSEGTHDHKTMLISFSNKATHEPYQKSNPPLSLLYDRITLWTLIGMTYTTTVPNYSRRDLVRFVVHLLVDGRR